MSKPGVPSHLEHYEDPRLYDRLYARRSVHVPFYAELAAEDRGPVLELGVGTGKVAIAMAERGASVVGVDSMPSMLERAKTQIAKQPRRVRDRISLRKGDLRHLRIGETFPLVIAPFNVFMHLYERRDVERALASIARHLRARGRFVFDVLMPDPFDLARSPHRVYSCGHITDPTTRERYRYTERFEYDGVRQLHQVTMGLLPTTPGARARRHLLVQRQFFPAELEALLYYNGFRIEAHWGNFERRPLHSDDESQILVCRRRASR